MVAALKARKEVRLTGQLLTATLAKVNDLPGS
jgi:hypothetical protein